MEILNFTAIDLAVRSEGNTLLEMILVITFVGLVLWGAVSGLSQSVAGTFESDNTVLDSAQTLDLPGS